MRNKITKLFLLALYAGCVSAAQNNNQDTITVSEECFTTGEPYMLKFTMSESFALAEKTPAELLQSLDTASLLRSSMPSYRPLTRSELCSLATLGVFGGLSLFAIKKAVEKFSSSYTAACYVYGIPGIIASLLSLAAGYRAYKGGVYADAVREAHTDSKAIQKILIGLSSKATELNAASNKAVSRKDGEVAYSIPCAYDSLNKPDSLARQCMSAGEARKQGVTFIDIRTDARQCFKAREKDAGTTWMLGSAAVALPCFGALAYNAFTRSVEKRHCF